MPAGRAPARPAVRAAGADHRGQGQGQILPARGEPPGQPARPARGPGPFDRSRPAFDRRRRDRGLPETPPRQTGAGGRDLRALARVAPREAGEALRPPAGARRRQARRAVREHRHQVRGAVPRTGVAREDPRPAWLPGGPGDFLRQRLRPVSPPSRAARTARGTLP